MVWLLTGATLGCVLLYFTKRKSPRREVWGQGLKITDLSDFSEDDSENELLESPLPLNNAFAVDVDNIILSLQREDITEEALDYLLKTELKASPADSI